MAYRFITIDGGNQPIEIRPINQPTGGESLALTLSAQAHAMAWVDLPKAWLWVDRARQLLNASASLDATPSADVRQRMRPGVSGGLPADQAKMLLQMRHVYLIGEAIANVYNALNIPWSNDPSARTLYRQWFAGPPDGSSSAQVLSHLYNRLDPYALQWFRSNDYRPMTDRPTERNQILFGGIMPRGAEGLFNRYYTANENHPRQFVFGAGLWLDVADQVSGGYPDPDMTYLLADRVQNRAFSVLGGFVQTSPNASETGVYRRLTQQINASMPWVNQHPTGRRVDPRSASAPTGGGPFVRNDVAVSPFATRAQIDSGVPDQDYLRALGAGLGPTAIPDDNWHNFWYDEAVLPGTPLMIGAPLANYLQFYDQWVHLLETTTMRQVVFNANVFAVYSNASQIHANGGNYQSFLGDALGMPQEIQNQITQQDPTLNAVSAGLGLTAAAVSSIGPYGAIAGLILGAASAATKVAAALVRQPIRGLYRDDLGRFKPIIDRGWMSGRPSSNPTDAPDMVVPDPPGANPKFSEFFGNPSQLAARIGVSAAQWRGMDEKSRSDSVASVAPTPVLQAALTEALNVWSAAPVSGSDASTSITRAASGSTHPSMWGSPTTKLLIALLLGGAVIGAIYYVNKAKSKAGSRRNVRKNPRRRTHRRRR